jgi:hypothetical protein
MWASGSPVVLAQTISTGFLRFSAYPLDCTTKKGREMQQQKRLLRLHGCDLLIAAVNTHRINVEAVLGA